MKKVAILHDALQGVNFGFVVKSAASYEFYGVDTHSTNWASWANSTNVKSLSAIDMPPGVIVGAFKQMEDAIFDRMISGDVDSVKVAIASRKDYMFAGTNRVKSASKTPAVFDTPIRHFKNSQYLNAVNYKGLAFRFDAQKSSMMREVKSNGYAFDIDRAKFMPRPSIEEKSLIRERIESAVSTSFERRLGVKALKTIVQQGERRKVGDFFKTEEKALGRAIGGGGGGTRSARRIGRAITSRFDPNAWDGDGDGIVQDSTPFQRPAIPGVNDRSTGGKVNTRAATRAWNEQSRRQQMQQAEGRGKPQRTSLRSTTKPAASEEIDAAPRRGTRPAAGLRSRMERGTVETGMRSRTKTPKTKKKTRATAGVDRVDAKDGSAWASMTQEQRSAVVQNLEKRKQKLQGIFKKSGLWDAWLTNPKTKKQYPGISRDSDFTDEFMVVLQAEIQEQERDSITRIMSDMAPGPDRDKKLAENDKAFQTFYRQFDDLRTIRNMQKNDSHEMLEHLHPPSKEAALGKGKDSGTKIEGTFPTMGRVDSTYYGKSGRAKKYVAEETLETGEKAKVKKRTSERLEGLSRRLLDPNPKRVARRERRKARKAGVGRTAGQAEAEKKGIARRIRRARREIAGRLRGQETAGKIAGRNQSGRLKHPLSVTGDKPADLKVKVTPEWTSRMAFIEGELSRFKRGEKTESKRIGKVTNESLLLIWENMEQNGLPTQIREDQVEMLVTAGWRPINRGVGNDTGFVDAYLTDEDRFIPGQGGSAYGIGEYWAFEGDSFSWSSSFGDARMLAFVSPSARVVKRSELDRIVEDGRKIKDAIRAYDAGFPEGEAEKTDPKDYVTGLLQHLEGRVTDADWDTPLGQVYRQLIDNYGKSSGKDSEDIWVAMQHVGKMFAHDMNYWAPVLGYDAIDMESGGPLVVHNRGAIIAVNKPLTNEQGQRIVRDAQAGIVSGAEPKKQKTPKTPKAAKGSSSAKVIDTSGWKQTGGQLGSNPGGQYTAPDGKKYYVKQGRSQSHVENEVLASALYRALNVPASRVDIGNDNGQVQVVSEWVPGSGPMSGNTLGERMAMRRGYVADAWLGNWDAFANSGNIKNDGQGRAVRIDHGGSLNYRAQGAPKGTQFGDEAREMETLRDPNFNPGGAGILRDITPQEIKQQVDDLKKITDQMITQMVSDAISDPNERAELIRKLIARRQWIIQNYG